MKCFLFFLVLFSLCSRAAAEGGVRGVVTNTDGEPLAYTTIQVEGSDNATISNVNGEYVLELESGTYDVIFRYLGYKTVKKRVSVTDKMQTMNVKMKQQSYLIREFAYEGGEEDESYAIMRKAIALAKIHRLSVEEYSAKFYVKGSFTLDKIPWVLRKTMESEDIDIEEGVTYVSESVTEVEYKRPNTMKQRVVSSRSNLPEAIDSPSIPYANTDFYRPKRGDFISPVHPNAFAVYDYKYAGTFQDDDHSVVRIKVMPKRKGHNKYEGYINLVEPSYAFHSLDLNITDENNIEYNIKQVYAPFNGIWMTVNRNVKMDVKMMGVEMRANYVTSTRDYEVKPAPVFKTLPTSEKELKAIIENEESEAALTKKEARKKAREIREKEKKEAIERGEDPLVEQVWKFEVDSGAYETPDSVWNSLRQVPLTEEEEKGYAEADSIQKVRAEKKRKNSAKTDGGFGVGDILTGGSYDFGEKITDHSQKHRISFDGILGGLNDFDIYNTVDGYVLKTGLKYRRKKEKSYSIYGGNLRYAFSRETFNGNMYHGGSIKNKFRYKIEGGKQVAPLNGSASVSNALNLGYTWFAEENFLKLYEKDYARFAAGFKLSDRMYFSASTEAARRRGLVNNSFRRIIDYDDRTFTPNHPENNNTADTRFDRHTMLLSSLSLTWRPFAGINIRNDNRYLNNSNRPKFVFRVYSGHLDDEFYRGEVNVEHKFDAGLIGDFKYSLTGGGFFGSTPRYFPDFFHFSGNQTLFAGAFSRFRNLDYFAYSTPGEYFEGFAAFEFRSLALTQIGAIKMLGWKESLFVNQALASGLTYTETGYRLSGIFRALGIDVYSGFFNSRFDHVGVRIKTPF